MMLIDSDKCDRSLQVLHWHQSNISVGSKLSAVDGYRPIFKKSFEDTVNDYCTAARVVL